MEIIEYGEIGWEPKMVFGISIDCKRRKISSRIGEQRMWNFISSFRIIWTFIRLCLPLCIIIRVLIYAQLITQTKRNSRHAAPMTPTAYWSFFFFYKKTVKTKCLRHVGVRLLDFIVAWRHFNGINSINSKCLSIQAYIFRLYIFATSNDTTNDNYMYRWV